MYNPKPNQVIESQNVTFIEPPPHKITRTDTEHKGEEDDQAKDIFWEDTINQAAMLQPAGTPQVSPTGLLGRLREQITRITPGVGFEDYDVMEEENMEVKSQEHGRSTRSSPKLVTQLQNELSKK